MHNLGNIAKLRFLAFVLFVECDNDGGKNDMSYNPWPHYSFSGKLRPFPQSQKRTVPGNIMRPDYADHPQGFPLSEQAVKGSGHIKVLDDEEIEGFFTIF